MEELKTVLLYEVLFDSVEAEKRSKDYAANIGRLKKELDDTRKEYEKGAISQKEYDKSMAAIIPQLKNAEKEHKALGKAISDNDRLQSEQVGSLKRQQAQIELLTDSLRGRNKAYLDSSGGKAEIAQLHSLTKEYDENSEKITKTKKSISDLIKEQNILGINVGDTVKAFKSGGEGAVTFAKSIFTTRGAMVALGAVPILFFLTALVAFFKSTDEGADKLEQSISYLTAAFDTLVQGIAPAGKLLSDLFTSPIETVKKLVKGTDEYNVSLGKVAAAANRAGLAQAAYTKTMQDVEDAENALIAQREKVGLQVDQALLKVKDRSLSEQQRIKILNEASQAEIQLARQTQKNATDAYNGVVTLNKEKATSRKLKDDEVKAELEAEAKMISAQRESLNTQQTIQNRRSALTEQDIADRKAAADKALENRKKAAQEEIYEEELKLIQARRRGQDTLAIEEEIIRKTGVAEQIGLAKNSQQRKLIQAKVEADIAELRINKAIEIQARLLNLQESQIKTLLANVKAGTLAELELNKALIDTEASREKDQVRQTIQNKELQETRIKQIDAETKRKLLDADKAFLTAQIALIQQRAELQQQAATNLLNRFNQDQQSKIGIEQDTAATLLANSKADSREESNARIAMIRANQAAELQAASESGLKDVALQKKINRINAEAARAASDERVNQRNKEIDKIQARAQQITQLVSHVFDAQSAAKLKQIDDQQKAELDSAGLSAEMRAGIEEKYSKKREEAEKDAANKRKRIAVIEAIIATATGIAKAIPNPFLIALAALTGAAQIATIEAQQFAEGGVIKLARGGVINGPSHAAGGVKYNFGRGRTVELEGEEGVINKRSMAIPWVRSMASRLNQVGGGVAFDGIGYQPTSRAEYGGGLPARGSDGGIDYSSMRRAMSDAVREMPAPIVSVIDIAAVQNQRNHVQASADFGTKSHA